MEKKILDRLQTIKYPGLEKNIVELKTVDRIEKKGDNLTIILNMANQEAFPFIEGAIKDLFKDKNVSVKLKAPPKKDIHYDTKLQKDDIVHVTLGFRLISKEAAQLLQLQDNKALTKLKILKVQSFKF